MKKDKQAKTILFGLAVGKKRSVKELADHCGVGELTVQNWISEAK